MYSGQIRRSQLCIGRMYPNTGIKESEKIILSEANGADEERRIELYNLLLMANMPLIFRMAEKTSCQYASLRIPAEDLVSAGCQGFLYALSKFDIEKGKNTRIGNFAILHIRDFMKNVVYNMSPGLSIPYIVFQNNRKYRKMEENSDENLEQAEARLKYTNLYKRCISFAFEEKDEERDENDYLYADRGETMDSLERMENSETVRRLLAEELTEDEFNVISARFGLTDGKSLSAKETSEYLGLSAKDCQSYFFSAIGKVRSSKRLANFAGFLGYGQESK